MMKEAITLFEFQKRFDSEEACMEFLEKLRWPNGFICPNCGHDVGYRISFRRLIQCAVCFRQTSVTAGTILHKTKTSLRKWFWMIYMMSEDKGGVSVRQLARQLGMHYDTAWHIAHKIRHAMESRDRTVTLAGFIELDEAIIGPQARKEGRPRTEVNSHPKPRSRRLGRKPTGKKKRKTQTEVVVLAEREHAHAGNVAFRVVERTTRHEIREVVETKVDECQQFKADGLQSHYVVQSLGHKISAFPMSGERGSNELPIVHRVISLVKRLLLGTYHGVSPRYLQQYLHEFAFKFNRRDTSVPIYESLLRACVFSVPVMYSELYR